MGTMTGLPEVLLTVQHGSTHLLIEVADGRVTLNVKATAAEARSFWSELGRAIEELEQQP